MWHLERNSYFHVPVCAPLQKPGVFCKAAESVCSHTKPVGGSSPGHFWPWLSSQCPGGDWKDPLQEFPQGPGRVRVWLHSHRSKQSVRNKQTNQSEYRGLRFWIHRLREEREPVKTDRLTYISVYAHSQWWTTHCGGAVEGHEVSRRCQCSTRRPITTGRGELAPAVDLPLSFKNLSEAGL